jgi:nitric oxide dioxygenase
MTPRQITLVEQTLAAVDLDDLTADFYRRAFATEPALAVMFTSDPKVQRTRFAAELAEIVCSIRSLDTFAASTRSLGISHRDYGVSTAHYRLMGNALVAALADALGSRWTEEVEEAWSLAYNLTAETMMLGAMEGPLQN